MKQILLLALLLLQGAIISHPAADGRVILTSGNEGLSAQISGDDDEDWLLQRSSDLANWSAMPEFGALLSGGAYAPSRIIGRPDGPMQFYRAVKTAGLYDPTLFRTIRLTFAQSNWQTLLANARTTGSNILGTLELDNGAVITGIGARYKGNTSYSMSGTKKSINLDINFTDDAARLLGMRTVNLNNAFGDETIMREPLYFNMMARYAPSPRGSMVRLYINGADWGVYSLIEQENTDLIKDWFPSNDGDRWRTPNMGTGGTGGGPGGGGGGNSAFSYLGTSLSLYTNSYELKTDNSTNAWQRLTNAIYVLNQTPTAQLRDKLEDVFAVDTWLWYLAMENVYADDDSYWNKGADYGFYYEPESGRIHPVQHDGNEAFTAGDVSLSPVQGATVTTRPLLYKMLPIQELRQRYLAHIRTILEESFNPATLTPQIDQFHRLSINAIIADTKKSYTMAAYTNDLVALKTWVTNRYNYLRTHAELTPLPPKILAVNDPIPQAVPGAAPFITARVEANGTNGIDSVWVYFRDKTYGKFTRSQMYDDGAHGDGAAGDGLYGGATASFPAGNKIHYYVEARSANTAKAAAFAPAGAELNTYSYRVDLVSGSAFPVVINEVMASNTKTIADPQGQYDDWIELHNTSTQDVELTGLYLSDARDNPRKWQFPAGTAIPAGGYLIVWADEDGNATPGLHANFKLAAGGEELFLIDTDQNLNAILDSVQFAEQTEDLSYGRSAANSAEFVQMSTTPGRANQ